MGKQVQQDDEQAAKWWLKAAEQGHADAQYFIGRMFEVGKGVDKNPDKAREWYEKAAAQGQEDAQEKLGLGRAPWGIDRPRQKQFEDELITLCQQYSREFTSHVSNFTGKLSMGGSHTEMWLEHVPTVIRFADEGFEDEDVRILAHVKFEGFAIGPEDAFDLRVSSAGLLVFNQGDLKGSWMWDEVPIRNFMYSSEPVTKGWGMGVLNSVMNLAKSFSDEEGEGYVHFIGDFRTGEKGYFQLGCQSCARILGRFLNDASRLAERYTR